MGVKGVVVDWFGGEGARFGDGDDGAGAGVVVEGVRVDGVGRLLGGEEEDGAGVGVGGGRLG